MMVILELFSGLVELAWLEGWDVLPGMAVTWEVLEGGRRYVFRLRPDVLWSDGTPLTAADFAYAWKRVLDPDTGAPLAPYLYDIGGARAFHRGEVADSDRVRVRALDEFTLLVELEGPAGYFLQLLGNCAALPVPGHVVEAHGEAWTEPANIATNGAFRLVSWQRGESMVLARDPQYRGRFPGNVQRVELCLLSDWSAALQMYEADRLDVFGLAGLPAPERDRARQRHAGEYISLPQLSTLYVGFGVPRPPFDDPRVRQALALAIDKEALAEVHMRGYASPASGGFVPPGVPGHSPEIGLPYDPQRARQLLADAGYPGGRGFPDVEALNYREDVPDEYLQTQWRENLGIQITWETPEVALVQRLQTGEPPHIWIIRWSADYSDPDNFLRTCPIRLRSRWRNEAYERLVEQARCMMDQEQRMDLYRRADRILVQEAAIVPLVYGRSHFLVKPWVKRYPGRWKDVIIEPH